MEKVKYRCVAACPELDCRHLPHCTIDGCHCGSPKWEPEPVSYQEYLGGPYIIRSKKSSYACHKCGTDVQLRLVSQSDGTAKWEIEPYCAHCGARLIKGGKWKMNISEEVAHWRCLTCVPPTWTSKYSFCKERNLRKENQRRRQNDKNNEK